MKSYLDKASIIADDAEAAAVAAEDLANGEGKPAALIRALETVAKKASALALRVRADRDKAKEAAAAAKEEDSE